MYSFAKKNTAAIYSSDRLKRNTCVLCSVPTYTLHINMYNYHQWPNSLFCAALHVSFPSQLDLQSLALSKFGVFTSKSCLGTFLTTGRPSPIHSPKGLSFVSFHFACWTSFHCNDQTLSSCFLYVFFFTKAFNVSKNLSHQMTYILKNMNAFTVCKSLEGKIIFWL